MSDYEKAWQVNRDINQGTKYVSDQEQFGVPEHWSEMGGKWQGDCDEYALSKFRQLVNKGISPDKMRLAAVFTETLEGGTRAIAKRRGDKNVMGDHLVLVVSTDSGDWILDNRHKDPIGSLSEVNYKLDRIWNWKLNGWEHGEW